MLKNPKKLKKQVYGVPQNIDTEIARLKLNARGVHRQAHPRAEKVPRFVGDWNVDECGMRSVECGVKHGES
jgi:S-adenosylhomocysteine hydrolase